MRIIDWISDVCASDLDGLADRDVFQLDRQGHHGAASRRGAPRPLDRKRGLAGKSVSVRVAPGGSRMLNQNKPKRKWIDTASRTDTSRSHVNTRTPTVG